MSTENSQLQRAVVSGTCTDMQVPSFCWQPGRQQPQHLTWPLIHVYQLLPPAQQLPWGQRAT
jgi:hypothetical protein